MGCDTKNDIDIPCSWVNRHKFQDKSHEHNHRNCLYSGIVYLECEPNGGDLIFTNHKFEMISPDEDTLQHIQQFEVDYQTREGHGCYVP